MAKYWIALCLILLLSEASLAQNERLDSLRNALNAVQADTTKILLWCDIGYELRTKQVDSVLLLANQAMALSEQLGYKRGMARALWIQGIFSWQKADLEKAKELYTRCQAVAKEAGDNFSYAHATHGLGTTAHRQGKYDEAMQYYEQAAEVRRKSNDLLNLVGTYGNMGVIYKQRGNVPKALEYYYLSLNVLSTIGKEQTLQYANVCGNVAIIYFHQKEYARCIPFFDKVRNIREKIGDRSGMSLTLGNMGETYKAMGQYDEAMKWLSQSYALAKELTDKYNMVYSLSNMIDIYLLRKDYPKALTCLQEGTEIAKELKSEPSKVEFLRRYSSYYLAQGDGGRAYQHAKEATGIANKLGEMQLRRDVNEALAQAAQKVGKFEEALLAYQQSKILSDSIENERNLKAALLKEFEQKESKIQLEQEKQALAHEAELERQRRIQNTYMGVIATTLIASLLIAFGYRQKQADNKLLNQRNEEITAQKSLITSKNEELNEVNEELKQQQEELILLNENLEKQSQVLKETYEQLQETSNKLEKSIEYASHIQEVVLPEEEQMRRFFSDLFVLYKPKDGVSGDFYWFAQTGENTCVLALADCTGHGVPGAFMSMLGSTFLHEIVHTKGIKDDPSRIMRNLHAGFRNILKQASGKNDDGMDISVCVFEKSEQGVKLIFAGAKSSIYYEQGGELHRIKGENQYIGGRGFKKEFLNQHFQLPAHTSFYLFTDGFSDQNGMDGRKFGSDRFRQLLLGLSSQPFDRQREGIQEALQAYQGHFPQRDDISIIGLRV